MEPLWYPQLTPCRAAGVTARGSSHGRGCRATPSTVPTPVLSRYPVGNAFFLCHSTQEDEKCEPVQTNGERAVRGTLFTRWKRKEAGGRKKREKEGEAADPPPSQILQSRRTLCQFFLVLDANADRCRCSPDAGRGLRVQRSGRVEYEKEGVDGNGKGEVGRSAATTP